MKKTNLDIQGMHCGSCAILIEHTLKKMDGVQDANVNFSAEKATVTRDEQKIQLVEIQEKVRQLGYKAFPADETLNPHKEEEKREKETHYRKHKFLRALLLSIPMIVFMIYDFISGMPYSKILMPRSALISLALTIPVLFIIGRDFYQGARSALRIKTSNMFSLIAIGTSVAFIYSLYNYILYYLQT
jgi:Cu+-exporting ATPase